MESISVFDIIKVGIGPSSSHTMGPWKAALAFVDYVRSCGGPEMIDSVDIHLYGSLALTGIGHGTDLAVVLGLTGADFQTIDPKIIIPKFKKIKCSKRLIFDSVREIPFDYQASIHFHKAELLPLHSNGMRLEAKTTDRQTLQLTAYSLGGGFISIEGQAASNERPITTPYPCHDAASIKNYCDQLGINVSELVRLNEQAWRIESDIESIALNLWSEIKACVFRGICREGVLPGGLNVARRAPRLNHRLTNEEFNDVDAWIDFIKTSNHSFEQVNKWVSCFALAVNEENASFGRIVTAPTNGASGVIPAVMMYAHCFAGFDEAQLIDFILVAGEIGTLYKKNATISAAMGGCQAEIGVSSSMAAAALANGLGGSPDQVMMAAEIAMEHHLGMTCDPVAGLVQIPCIERNCMGAIKAITAANIALESDPDSAVVSLDDVIQSMWQTAQDMNYKYKETSQGGLAVNISVNLVEC